MEARIADPPIHAPRPVSMCIGETETVYEQMLFNHGSSVGDQVWSNPFLLRDKKGNGYDSQKLQCVL